MNTAKLLMIVALLANASAVMATIESEKPKKVEAFYADHIGTVEQIDHESGALAVKDDKGNTMLMQIYPEVHSFDQVNQGDRGNIEYLESVVVSLLQASEPGANVPEPTGESIIVRNPGVKTSQIPVETYTVTGTLDKVNYKQRYKILLAELKGPNGNSYRVSFPKEIRDARKLDNGDQVTVELTPMLALDIDPR
jgi:hypothetical protein